MLKWRMRMLLLQCQPVAAVVGLQHAIPSCSHACQEHNTVITNMDAHKQAAAHAAVLPPDRRRSCKSNCDSYNGEFIWNTGEANYQCRVQVRARQQGSRQHLVHSLVAAKCSGCTLMHVSVVGLSRQPQRSMFTQCLTD